MSSINTSQIAECAAELRTAMVTATPTLIGTLIHNPVHLIFDNQGANAVAISTDGGVTTWHTFPAGEAIILDMRGNKGMAANYTFSIGTTFTGTGTTGRFFFNFLYLCIE